MKFSITSTHDNHHARSGRLETAHGIVKTPCFMPVGTKASVKGIDPEILINIHSQVVLANTYHLMLRPGEELIHDMGGLHKWAGYNKPMLTDSGGFQIFSLGSARLKKGQKLEKELVHISEDGVKFQSYLDGNWRYVTPEEAISIQSKIGADIIMAFDECAPGNSSHDYAKKAMNRTHRWLERCVTQWISLGRQSSHGYAQGLFGIVQGVVYDDLRKQSAEFVSNISELSGVAIGGLSVGESKEDMKRILETVLPLLPANKPRYLMGVGTPSDLKMAIELGVDMFDCVLPTRLGRHGAFWLGEERLSIKREIFRKDPLPLDPNCDCRSCQRFSRSYLRHLIMENEILGMQALSEHNLYQLCSIAESYRK